MGGLSFHAFAHRVGVSPQAISQAVRDGRLVPLPSGLIDEEEGKAQWALISPPATRPTGKPPSASVEQASQAAMARAAKLVFEAQILELELKEKKGELVSVAEVSAAMRSAAVRVREHLLAVASRVAPLFPENPNAFAIIQAEMHRACEELSQIKFLKDE